MNTRDLVFHTESLYNNLEFFQISLTLWYVLCWNKSQTSLHNYVQLMLYVKLCNEQNHQDFRLRKRVLTSFNDK